MKILLISDVEDPLLWDYFSPGKLDGYDLILSAGDLDSAYLSFLVTMGHAPVFYVHGNHDGRYTLFPPEGCECIEDRVVTFQGVRILGLGGSVLYNGGSFQYTERQMRRRVFRAGFPIRRAKGVDLIVTHAPPKGVGDDADYAHRGFEACLPLLRRWRPKALIHGHVHVLFGVNRVNRCGETLVINATRRCDLYLGEAGATSPVAVYLP